MEKWSWVLCTIFAILAAINIGFGTGSYLIGLGVFCALVMMLTCANQICQRI